jgi:hypothetical protein
MIVQKLASASSRGPSIQHPASSIKHRVSSINYFGIQPKVLNASSSAIETNTDLTRVDNNRNLTFPI